MAVPGNQANFYLALIALFKLLAHTLYLDKIKEATE